MRITPAHSGLQHPRSPGADPALAAAAERESGRPDRRARPPVTRVFEGEVVPRPTAAAPRFDDAGRAPLAAAAIPEPPGAPLPSASPKTLFYLLHSSDELLGARRLGSRIDELA